MFRATRTALPRPARLLQRSYASKDVVFGNDARQGMLKAITLKDPVENLGARYVRI